MKSRYCLSTDHSCGDKQPIVATIEPSFLSSHKVVVLKHRRESHIETPLSGDNQRGRGPTASVSGYPSVSKSER